MNGDSTASGVPLPIQRGPELDALARFSPDVTGTGKIEAGGMGPGTPAMAAVGRGTHPSIPDERWLVGE